MGPICVPLQNKDNQLTQAFRDYTLQN